MAYIKFADREVLAKGTVRPLNDHVVAIEFKEPQTVDTSGFQLFLDAEGTVNLDEEGHYLNYITLYRLIDDKHFEYSNDGLEYVEPVIPEEPEPETPVEPEEPEPEEPTELTEEEKAAKEEEMRDDEGTLSNEELTEALSDLTLMIMEMLETEE